MAPITASGENPNISPALSGIIASLIVMIALEYCWVIYWSLAAANRVPLEVNKVSGLYVRRYAPAVYVFIFASALIETAVSTWLIVQYRYHRNYPNVGTRTGVRILLCTACWTTVTAGLYTVAFIHPNYSRHPIVSVGAQALWIFISWIFWVTGSAILLHFVSSTFVGGDCSGVIYCSQLQTLYGA
ncbi:hypothetical protein CPB85DRAFT_1231200 [Mucidula mucida]|nr:hypothetical protein CPB85DRAFT_1231200 [Mucidula mucida]